MKRNALSLGLCLLYIAATAACWVEVLIKSGDPKSTFVLKQLPIALQIALADALGFRALMTDMSWAAAYAIFFPLTIALLYGVGRLVTWLVSKPV